jgi:ABC-type uncharacterized transport system involved in gliding motility auxiliary subunit
MNVRTVLGFAALLAILIGLNVLVLQEDLFAPVALIPLGIGLALGLLWVLWRLMDAAQSGRTTATGVSGFNTVVSSLVFLGICIVIYAFALRFTKTWDLTQEGRRELSPQTIQVLENLTQDVQVTGLFVDAGDQLTHNVMTKTRRFLERCQQYTDRLHVEFFDPQLRRDRLDQLGVLRVYGVGTVVLASGAKQREIPLSDVTSRLEERDFTNALINVVRDVTPKVCFLTGHGERDIDNPDPVLGGSSLRLWLQQESYQVEKIAIPLSNPMIPPDCSVLVIGGFVSDFHPAELQAIDEYLAGGGRMLVMVDPQRLDVQALSGPGPMQIVEHFRPWLRERLGVRLGADAVISEVQTQYTQNPLELLLLPDYSLLGDFPFSGDPNDPMRRAFNMEHPITRGFDQQMILSAARSVNLERPMPEGVLGSVLLWSSPKSWAEEDLEAMYTTGSVSRSSTEQGGPVPLAVAVTMRTEVPLGATGRTKDARVVVVGDSDFVSNEKIRLAGNHNFALNAIAWLTESEELIAIRPTGTEDPPIILTRGQQQVIAWIAALGLVQVVTAAGIGMYFWRRRYQ